MASSFGRLLAAAVVAELNDPARSWYQRFTAVQLWRPYFTLDELGSELKASVFPIGRDPINLTDTKGTTRQKRRYDYRIILDFQQQCDGDDTEKVASLVDLIDADVTAFYADLHYLSGNGLASGVWYVSEVAYVDDSLYNLDRLIDERIFESALQLTITGFA